MVQQVNKYFTNPPDGGFNLREIEVANLNIPVYLDYSATTPVDERVAKAMTDCLTLQGNFGNPASRSHVFGWKAEDAVTEARANVAKLIGADPREIVWTSGATESDNLAIKGAAHFNSSLSLIHI